MTDEKSTLRITEKLDSLVGICWKSEKEELYTSFLHVSICTSAICLFVPETLFYI